MQIYRISHFHMKNDLNDIRIRRVEKALSDIQGWCTDALSKMEKLDTQSLSNISAVMSAIHYESIMIRQSVGILDPE